MKRKRSVSHPTAQPVTRRATSVPAPGRPRSPAADVAILDAAIALVREVGFDAVTMEGIAARAGVGKATIYRRWSSRELLVADAIRRITLAMTVPDTGSVDADLRVVMRGTLGMYRDPASAALLSGLVSAMVRSEEIAAAVRSGFVATRRRATRTVLERGVARGELRDDVDLEIAVDMLSGPLLLRMLVTGAPIDDRLATGVVDMVLGALRIERT